VRLIDPQGKVPTSTIRETCQVSKAGASIIQIYSYSRAGDDDTGAEPLQLAALHHMPSSQDSRHSRDTWSPPTSPMSDEDSWCVSVALHTSAPLSALLTLVANE
jgi:hypothetical protein